MRKLIQLLDNILLLCLVLMLSGCSENQADTCIPDIGIESDLYEQEGGNEQTTKADEGLIDEESTQKEVENVLEEMISMDSQLETQKTIVEEEISQTTTLNVMENMAAVVTESTTQKDKEKQEKVTTMVIEKNTEKATTKATEKSSTRVTEKTTEKNTSKTTEKATVKPTTDVILPTTDEETTKIPTGIVKDRYAVNIKIYKEVNNIKSYVKTITITGNKGDIYKIPLTLQEDKRCRLKGECRDLTGFHEVPASLFEGYVNWYPQYLWGVVEGEHIKAKIEGNSEFELTYYYKDVKVNIYKMSEDYSEQIIDSYVISAGLGDLMYFDLALKDAPVYELDTVEASNPSSNGAYWNISTYSYKVYWENGNTSGFYEESVPGCYEIGANFFKDDINELNVRYYGYNYSRPIYDSIIKEGMSEYQKAKAIHDWLVNNCYYDFSFEYGLESFLAIGIFKNKYGVCDGYTYAFKQLAEWAGLECERFVCVDMEHSWNRVKIDGQWYNVDCTYSDANMTFFLKSDAYFVNKGHHYGFVSDGKCTSTKYD